MLEEILTEEQLIKTVHQTFEKFKNGNCIDNEVEYNILKDYALTGLVRFGISHEGKATAALTDTGVHYLKIMKRYNTI